MTCRGICIRHRALKPNGRGRYVDGQKRCQVCEVFLRWENLWCPCCGYRLRTRPRNIKYKSKLLGIRKTSESSLHHYKWQIIHISDIFFVQHCNYSSLLLGPDTFAHIPSTSHLFIMNSMMLGTGNPIWCFEIDGSLWFLIFRCTIEYS